MALTQQDKEELYQYLIQRGKTLGSLDEGDSNLSNKYLAPVLEYSGGTASKAVRLAVSLLQGKSAVIRKSGDLVQWQLQGASTWETLYSMADYRGLPGADGADGADGKNPVFRKNAANLEYKLDGEADTAYRLLVALADITGPEGDHIVLRVQDGKLEYKQSKAADSTYQQLLAIEDLRGPQGRPGKDFQILGYYDTLTALRAAVTSPQPGVAYGVGTAAPYPIYIWDAVSQDWVNNGAIQGPAGRSGKSARVNTASGYWEEFDDDTQTWKPTEALGVYHVASAEKDGLMSKDDKAKLDQIKGGDVEVSKANVEKVLTGNIQSHAHDTERRMAEMPTDIWDGATISTTLAGSGTAEDPYLIQSCADYIHFYRNPSVYGHTFGTSGPTEVQLLNPKQVKLVSHLNFDNHPLDFGNTLVNINTTPEEEIFSKSLVLINVDGQGCHLSNIHFTNTWSVLPFGAYSAVRNLHVRSGILTVPLNTIHELGLATTDSNTAILSPWTLIGGMSLVENVSLVAEINFTGDTELTLTFVGGSFAIRTIEPYVTSGLSDTSYFYSHITFSCDAGMANAVTVLYSPSVVNYTPSAPLSVIGYDCTQAVKEEPSEPISGLVVGMLIDGISENEYTLYVNTDHALPIYNSSSTTPFHSAKTTAEMKSAEFLALLNGKTETFVADTENVNDGYPVFKPNKVAQVVYDGYVKESAFEAFKHNVSADGSRNIYHLDMDISGEISKLDANSQTLGWGKTYTAPTNDNIVELLGGNDGIRDLCEKLAPSNNPIVTAPFLAYILPSTLVSSAVLVSILNSEGNAYTSLVDGGQVMMGMQFYLYMNKAIYSIESSITISNFNLSTQSATYRYSMEQIKTSSGQSTEVVDYLTSTNTIAALSANQGRVLKGLIDNISATTVENSLTSSSTTHALSAAQGKALKTLVDGKVASTEITTIKKLTQSAYDALSSKDSNTLYIIA